MGLVCFLELLRANFPHLLSVSDMVETTKCTLQRAFEALRFEEASGTRERFAVVSVPLRMGIVSLVGMLLDEFRQDREMWAFLLLY